MNAPGPAHPDRAKPGPLLAAFALFALALTWDTSLLGPLAMVRIHDSFDSEFMYHLARARMLLENGLFNWDPTWAGGAPSFAGQFTPYALPTLVSTILPPWLLNALLRFLLALAACWGVFRLLRDHLRVSPLFSALCGALFACSALSLVPMRLFEHVFPLFFVWSLDVFDGSRSPAHRAATVLGLLLMALFSYPVITLPFFSTAQFFLVLGLWLGAAQEERHFPARRMVGTFLLWTAYLLLFAPTILKLFEFIPLAQRTYSAPDYATATAALIEFCRLFTMKALAYPSLALLLLVIPQTLRARHGRLALGFIIVPAVFAAFMQGRFSPAVADSFISKMDLANFDFLVPMGYAMATGLGLEGLRRSGGRGAPLLALAGLAFSVWLWLTGVTTLFTLGVSTATLAAGFCALRLMTPESEGVRSGRVVICAVSVAATLSMALPLMLTYHVQYGKWFDSFPELKALAKEGKNDPFRVGCVNLPPAVALSHGFESAEHRGPLSNKFYKELFQHVIAPQLDDADAQDFYHANWYDILLTQLPPGTTASEETLYNADNWDPDLLRLLNVRYLLSFHPIAGIEHYADLAMETKSVPPLRFIASTPLAGFASGTIWVYRVRGTFARAWFAPKVRTFDTREQALEALLGSDLEELQGTAFLSAEDSQALPQDFETAETSPNAGSVRFLSREPDRIELEVVAASPGVLIIANNYDSHWSATVNAEPAPVLRVDHAFQGVPIYGTGTARIVLSYADPLVWKAHWASLAGLALFLSALFFGTRNRLRQAPEPMLPLPGVPSLGQTILIGLVTGCAFVVAFTLGTGSPLANGYHLYWCAVMPVGAVLSALAARGLLKHSRGDGPCA